MADAIYLVSKIEDGSQLTRSTNISETMTYIIEIPITANLHHSTMANSQDMQAYLGDSNDQQSEMAAETVYRPMCMLIFPVLPTSRLSQ